jgi:hypothetical protein
MIRDYLRTLAPIAVPSILVLVVLAVTSLVAPTDDTDAGSFERSGMSLHVDHGTGCHYLSRWFSEPVPRLDGEGNHVGCHGASSKTASDTSE